MYIDQSIASPVKQSELREFLFQREDEGASNARTCIVQDFRVNISLNVLHPPFVRSEQIASTAGREDPKKILVHCTRIV